jgi:hypothetical protein
MWQSDSVNDAENSANRSPPDLAAFSFSAAFLDALLERAGASCMETIFSQF